jgi:hypothetical protein
VKVAALLLAWALPALAARGPTTLLCETSEGATEKAKIVAKMPSGQTLFVCGKIRKAKGNTELSAFKVHVLSAEGKKLPRTAFEDASPTLYRMIDREGALAFQELISDGKESIPAFETKVECDESACKKSPAECIFSPSADPSRKPLDQLKPYLSGPKSGPKSGKVPPVSLIHGLARLAYRGEAEALKLFQDRGPLSLDGAASDAYFDHQAALTRLKKSGCLSDPAQPANK